MKKLFLLSIFFVWLTNDVLAQEVSAPDSIAVFQLINKAYSFQYTNGDSAFYYANTAIRESERLQYEYGKAIALTRKAKYYEVHNEFKKALDVFSLAIEILKKLNRTDKIATIYCNLGLMHFSQNDSEKAIEFYQKAENLCLEVGDSNLLASIKMNMASAYGKYGETSKSLQLMVEASNLFKLTKDTAEWGMSYHYMSQLFNLMQESEKALKSSKKAEKIITDFKNNRKREFYLAYIYLTQGEILPNLPNKEKETLAISERMIAMGKQQNIPTIYGKGYSTRGSVFKKQEQYDSAVYYYQKSYDILKDHAFKDIVADNALILGHLYSALKQYSKAIFYLNESLNLEKTTEGHLDRVKDIYLELSRVYEKKGDFKQAHHYMEQHRISVDSLFARQKLKIIQEVEAEFKTKEQTAELELKETQLARQRTFIIASSLLTLVLLGFGIFAYRTAQRRKHTNALLQKQSEQLQSLDKAKSRFFANISHELRTPLTLIIAPLDNALKRVKDKFVKDDLKLAHSNSKKLLSLVNEILDLTKLESGQMRLNEASIPLEGFLKRILFSYHSLANIRGFMLSFQYYLDNDLVIKTDANKLEKIINNLLSNAFKYSNAGGVITLKVAELGNQQIQISVQDQGKGIAADELNRIFDRFYQVENKDEPLQGGTGIGLSLARELAEALGGTLKVESQVDKGTTFKVVIPLVKGEWKPIENIDIPEPKTAIPAYIPMSLNAKESHILIVEDNPEMSKFLVQILSPHYQCTTAADGKKALKLLQNRSFDLITSDVMMPNMDGFTLLESVRDLQNSQSTPFILLTARSLEEDKLKGLQLGVDDYITKPFSTNQLIARINNLLVNQQKRQSWTTEQKANTNEPPQSAEKEMLKKAEQCVVNNISNPKYRVENLASDMSYSRRQLSRIIQKMTGLTPVEFIREIRLLKAYQMLEQRQYLTISEVRFEVGFENASYFTKVFTKRFGVKPSEVVELV